MSNDFQIRYTPTPSAEEIQVLYDGIAGFAQEKKNQPPIPRLRKGGKTFKSMISGIDCSRKD